jgi:nitrogen fixation/metabolism regulation signal transduction histidine kinase
MLVRTHIISDLEDAMISRNHAGIPKVLELYRSYQEIKEVRVFDVRGGEVFAKTPGPPEARVGEVLRTGKLVYIDREIDRKPVVSIIVPLKNRPPCHGCHDKGDSLRGALLLSLSLGEMKKDIEHRDWKFSMLFALVAVAIATATIVAVNRLFVGPLNRIQKGTEAVGRGDSNYQIPVKSSDEIGTLTKGLNQMVQTIQRKNEELWEQLRLIFRSQKEWQETFDSITDLICVIDKDFMIIKANRTFHEYFSLPPYSEVNKKCYKLFGTCCQSDCPHISSMQNRTPVTIEMRDARTGKILQVSLFPCFSSEGDFTSSIFIAKDISERKENEMHQIMNERLVVLGQMASGIAHEVNNPLATIAACAEGLLKRLRKGQLDASFFENYLKVINEEVARCKGITTSMLSFVRKTSDEKKEVRLNEVVDKTLEMIGFLGRLKGVELLKDFHEGLPVVHGNEGELRQAVQVLIMNALDAMEDRGNLTVGTRIEGETVQIMISDTGPGIPSSNIQRIFDPFFTTKLEKGGTGLGLSIASRIVKEHGGKIDVLSEEGKGTTFTILLPV